MNPIHDAAQAGHMMGGMGTMGRPLAQGAMLASAGYAAGRGLLGRGILSNPLLMLAAGITAGYFLHKYEKEIVIALTKASGMGKDFMLNQRERLEDILQEAQQGETGAAPAAPANPPQA